MPRALPLAAAVLLLTPLSALATVPYGDALQLSDPGAANAYVVGTDVRIATTTAGDLSAAGGSLTVSAPIGGDALLAGGTIDILRPVAGDVRAFGGTVVIEDAVAGDVAALGGLVSVRGRAKHALLAGGSVEMVGGSGGSATIYGANVLLSGTFDGDVRVYASDHVTLAEGTLIHGSLKYNAPQQADIPASALVDGGVVYTGSSSFLPTNQEAKTFALAGAGVFFIVSLVAAMIAAGLVAGFFPEFTQRVADAALARTTRRFVLLALLGFATLVATPVFLLFLVVSFVGIGVAALLGAAYLLLLVLSYLYAAVLAGSALMRSLRKRPTVFWRDAVFGVLALKLISVIPGLGLLVSSILTAAAAGAILSISFRFAFKREDAIEQL